MTVLVGQQLIQDTESRLEAAAADVVVVSYWSSRKPIPSSKSRFWSRGPPIITLQVRIQDLVKGGPLADPGGPPPTPGFEAPKLSFLGPLLIFMYFF